MEKLAEEKAGFRSLTEAIDTTTPAGRMMLHMLGSFAEFERAMLRERTKAGLESARREGGIGGRRPKLNTSQRQEILRLVENGSEPERMAASRRGAIVQRKDEALLWKEIGGIRGIPARLRMRAVHWNEAPHLYR